MNLTIYGFRRFLAALAFAGAATLAVCPARAEPTASERSEARALFDEGRRLIAAQNYAAACPKLEESQRIDPGLGTQFNLADCQERIGRTASAWENFLEVANGAKLAGQQAREQVARARAAALEPKIARLVISVDPAAGEVSVKRDGSEVRRPLWGTAVPIDAGDHEIVATAPGRLPFRKVVTIKPGPDRASLAIPALAPAPVDAVAEGNAPARGLSGRRLAAVVVGGVGFASLGIGVGVALAAKSKADSSKPDCDPANPNRCTGAGVAIRNDARALGDVATVLFIGGGAAMGAGVVLWLTAPAPASPAAPTAGLVFRPARLSFEGTF